MNAKDRIDEAYKTNDKAYFHGEQFEKDFDELGWTLKELYDYWKTLDEK